MYTSAVPVQPPQPTPPHSREGTESTPPPKWGRLGGGEQLPSALHLRALFPHLATHIEELRHWQILDPTSPDVGALVNPGYGCADNKSTSAFVTQAAYLLLATGVDDPELLARMNVAAAYLLAAQRPSGNIDLPSVNIDSGPDTGFTVQQLCTIFELARRERRDTGGWLPVLEKLERFIRGAVEGMKIGGFHTPNHRWVICSALTQARTIFPDLEVAEVVESYLAEGYDIDPEGAFIERSVGVYDAVNDRSLLFIQENWDSPAALHATARNLDFCLHLLHADGTAETGLSRRQDYGTRSVTAGLVHCYLLHNHFAPTAHFVSAAHWLWDAKAAGENLLWTVYALLKCGDPAPASAPLPTSYSRHFPHNGLWRIRRERLSASIFQDATRLLTLVHGQAELTSLKISQTYFGGACGHFFGEKLDVAEGVGVLTSGGLRRPRRPGYELPLGRPVSPQEWNTAFAQRELYELPAAASTLRVSEAEGGLDFHYRNVQCVDKVAVQIAFDFPPGGVWETDDTRTIPAAGQPIFLKRGYGQMRYGSDVIRIGPGAATHFMWPMRDAETAPNHSRVLLTFWTPVDFQFQIRTFRGVG
ncbi:MAG: hypothetical protein KJZ86_13595 [Caldilineaceae bacterium]|nr:hypothetical protein [Caldilineaceae bacterium]